MVGRKQIGRRIGTAGAAVMLEVIRRLAVLLRIGSRMTRIAHYVHVPHDELPLRVMFTRMRHDGCGGGPAKEELLTGVEGVSSRPMPRVVLRGG